MAYAYVGSAQNVSNANTVTYSPTAGNYLVVVVQTSIGGGTPTASIADNGSGVWTTRKATVMDGASSFTWYSVFTCSAAASGVTTVTLTFNGGTPVNTNIALAEYSGLSATGWQGISAFHEQAAPGIGANLITSNALTATAQPAIIIGWMVDEGANGGWTAGTTPIAFTRRVNGAANMLEDARITATGSVVATATNTHGAADTFMSYVMAISEPVTGVISKGFVASNGINGATNTTPTGFTSHATGDGLYVIAVAGGTGGANVSPTITDTYGNSWTQIGAIFQAGSSSFFESRYYCQNANGGANHQVTATFGTIPSFGSYVAFIQILGGSLTALYSGVSNATTYPSNVLNPFSSGNVSIIPPVGGALLISNLSFATSTANEGTVTEANGFALDTMLSTAFAANIQTGSLVETSAGTYNASWSSTKADTGATPFIAVIDVFNPLGTGGGPVGAGPAARCIYVMP